MDRYNRIDVVGIERENEKDENYKSTKNPDIDLSRTNGNYHIVFHKGIYKAHYRRNGLAVFACANEFDKMKRKFMLKLNQLADANVQPITQRKPESTPQEVKKEDTVLFTDYVKQWLEINARRPKQALSKSTKDFATITF